MKYGAMNFPVKPVVEEIKNIAALGFDYLELAMDPPEADHAAIRRHQAEIMAALREHELGLICHLPTFVYTADLSDRIRKASVDEVVLSLEASADLGAETVVLHPGYIGGLGAHVMDRSMAYAMESLERFSEVAAHLGLKVCIENMFPKYPGWIEPGDFSPVMDRNPSLMLTLDIGHAHIGSKRERRFLKFIEAFPDRIHHIHVSDNFGKEDSHLPIGAGSIRFKKVVKGLKKIGYDRSVTVEVFSSNRAFLGYGRESMSQWFESV